MRSSHDNGNRTRIAGFSLIELMLVIVIIGFLSALAIPAYMRHITQSHRHAATACLMQYSHYMERHYATHLSYALEDGLPLLECAHHTQDTYIYRVETMDHHYTLEATPVNTHARRDTACATLTLTTAGVRGATGDDHAQCW